MAENKPKRQMHGGGGMRFDKPNNIKTSLKKLFIYLKPYILFMIIGLVVASLGTVLTIIGPKQLGKITSLIQEGALLNMMGIGEIDLVAISSLAFKLVLIYIGALILNIIQGLVLTQVSQKISHDLRLKIASKINKLPLSYFDNQSIGDVLSRVTNDADLVGLTLNNSLSVLITSLTAIIGATLMMFTIDVGLTLIVLIIIPVCVIIMMLVMKTTQKLFRLQQKSLGKLNGLIEEVYTNHQIVKVFDASERFNKEHNDINNTYFKSAWKSQFFSGLMQPIMMFIGNVAYVFVTIFGGIKLLLGNILVGDLQSMFIYIHQFINPLSNIGMSFNHLQSTIAAAERIFEFLEAKEMDEDKPILYLDPKIVKGEVEFDNVVFGYVSDKTIIKSFNASIFSGQKIAIVGPTGAGKTTLVNLLMRFYEMNSGDIRIDGVSIKDISKSNLREIFSMVLQDTWLFEGTIYENIVYGNELVTKQEVQRACHMAKVDHYIESLVNSYDTILDEKATLSSGQKQLLTIARAMIEDAPMLILDEATSNVDTRTEVMIQIAMDNLMKGRTTFVIAHRLSTIKNADLILVLKDGDIIEQGTHEQLLELNGFYADIYNSQFERVS